MATHAAKTLHMRNALIRTYATQSKTSPVSSARLEINTTTLPNKLIVASAENDSPISRVSILLRAGSRYEAQDTLGAAHILRIAAGLSTQNSSSLAITRITQKVGANITAAVDREIVAYTLEGNRDAVEETLCLLGDVASRQCFKPWELTDSIPRLKYELAGLSPQVLVVDMLHKAAYRSGLGNSLFCPKHRVGKISTETMLHYTNCNFTTHSAAVVGLGVDYCELTAFAKELSFGSGAVPVPPSKYFGGDLRHETGGPLAHIALATEGGAIKNEKESLAFAVLQHIMGTGPHTKYGTEARSPLYKAVSSGMSSCPFAISALNAQYSDSGLFGFMISAPGSVAGKAVDSAVKELRKGSVDADQVTRGKKQLKVAVLSTLESGSALLEDIGQQVIYSGCVKDISQIIAAIDSVSANDVSAAAKKVASGKLSVAAVGSLSSVPYADQLK